MPVKLYHPLPKTNKIFIGETKIYKDTKVTTKGIKDIGVPADDDPYYQEVVKEYISALKDELVKNGFTLVEQATPQSLIIKTTIGDEPPPLGGWLGAGAMGIVMIQVEVAQEDKALLHFEQGANTTLGYKAKKQVVRLVPGIVKKIKEHL